MEQKKRLTRTVIIFIFAALAIGVFLATRGLNFKNVAGNKNAPPADINLLSSKDAYQIGLDRAREWQKDAVLARVLSSAGETGVSGRSDNWQLLFTSKSVKGKALQVVISNRIISSASEINYSAAGAELPDDIISSQEAVARAHSIKGYENEPVISVEIIYGPDGKQWYWGVKTTKGTITINAKK